MDPMKNELFHVTLTLQDKLEQEPLEMNGTIPQWRVDINALTACNDFQTDNNGNYRKIICPDFLDPFGLLFVNRIVTLSGYVIIKLRKNHTSSSEFY